MEGRYLEEEVQGSRGPKMGQSAIEEFFSTSLTVRRDISV
jgi:hypothetical protein